jgi:NAD(P)-dependent dehydrogenase (short-subunit alcohol dehydrogenase family)
VVVVLDDHDAMGVAGSSLSSMYVGAVLSLARTFAMELLRDGIYVNTVLAPVYPGTRSTGPAPADVLRAAQTFLAPDAHALSGQELFVTDGHESGRLHP